MVAIATEACRSPTILQFRCSITWQGLASVGAVWRGQQSISAVPKGFDLWSEVWREVWSQREGANTYTPCPHSSPLYSTPCPLSTIPRPSDSVHLSRQGHMPATSCVSLCVILYLCSLIPGCSYQFPLSLLPWDCPPPPSLPASNPLGFGFYCSLFLGSGSMHEVS